VAEGWGGSGDAIGQLAVSGEVVTYGQCNNGMGRARHIAGCVVASRPGSSGFIDGGTQGCTRGVSACPDAGAQWLRTITDSGDRWYIDS